ncbi:MAG: hypothetical protein K0R57_132 [Paenibacillaceae bacterium]|jgi:putative selenium metabolism hydrolase|nr:hypothetical protein [Paenibacillaceae bacterium]
MRISSEELIHFCRQLIGIKSLPGQEGQAAALLREKMLELGFDEVRTDRLGNVVGRLMGKAGGPVLLLDGHLDTSPVTDAEAWQFDPFGGELEQGRIYGRGATDMKGALSAMLFAAAQLKRAGIQPEGDIYVSGTVCGGITGGAALKEVMDAVRPDFVVIGKATGLNLHVGQRGRAELKAVASGQAACFAGHGQETNAISLMLPFLDKLSLTIPMEHDQLGRNTCTVTGIISSPYPGSSLIPERCTVTLDRRLLAGEEEAEVLRAYRELDRRIQVDIAEQSLACYTGAVISERSFYPAWLMEVDHPLVELSMRALHQQGIAARISAYLGCTNGSYSAGIAQVPTVGFGPSWERLTRAPDEYIEIEQLIKANQGYYAIARAWALQTPSDHKRSSALI